METVDMLQCRHLVMVGVMRPSAAQGRTGLENEVKLVG